MKYRLRLIILGLCSLAATIPGWSQNDSLPTTPLPAITLQDYQVQYNGTSLLFEASPSTTGLATLTINGEALALTFEQGKASMDWPTDLHGQLVFLENGEQHRLIHVSLRNDGSGRLRPIPLWLSIIPPLLAIALALIFKEVLISLFLGIWAGAFVAGGLRFESFGYYFSSFWDVVEIYVIKALSDGGHLAVIIFSLLIGGMVAIISRNGGMAGIVVHLSKYARTPVSTQFVTWLLGVAIFFDDYANTLIVGNTMRPVTDRFRISREKLAYIVDSTAAPVSAVAFITTWIGAELGYIGDGIANLRDFPELTPYAIFLDSLKYSFYPVLTLSFILMVIYLRRDFGPMYQAEMRARQTGEVSKKSKKSEDTVSTEDLNPVKGAPLRWYNAFFPVLTVIVMTIIGLLVTGFENTYQSLVGNGIEIASMSWADTWSALTLDGKTSFFTKLGALIGNSDSYAALLWSSLSGVVLAILMTLSARIMDLEDTMNTLVTGFKTMLPALLILTLAWALAEVTSVLHTAEFLSTNLQDSLNPYWLPVIIFILAALIAFSTGSSWSTMAILYPLVIPTTWAVTQSAGLSAEVSMEILLNVIAVVLAASVLGDHCSPISDTTILSSLASDCNHIDHVRTQLPYALLVGTISLLCGGLSTYFGGGWGMSLLLGLLGLGLMALFLLRFGKKIEDSPENT